MRRSCVLIVEDNDGIRSALATLLTLQGYLVEEAKDGQEALSLLRQGHKPALILLDLMMPVMNGWAFLGVKQQDKALASIPVVVMSAVATLQPPRKTRDIVGTVDKLVDMARLLKLVRQYCGPNQGRAAAL